MNARTSDNGARAGRETARLEHLPPRDTRWSEFVSRVPEATIFHHPDWLQLVARSYGYPLDVRCIVGADDTIRAGLPVALVSSRLTGRRLVCVPFSDHAAPLAITRDDALLLTSALRSACAETGPPLHVHGPLPEQEGVRVLARYHHHTLALREDVEEVIRRFRRRAALLRGARRAVRDGLQYERRTDEAALRVFYRLNQLTRRRLGVPVQPRRFILGMAPLLRHGRGFVGVVRDRAGPVAAAVFLTHRGTLYYKYGASDPAALPRRPNNLLFLEVIRAACEEGMERLDFGRTDIGHEGLRAFKLSFGSDEQELVYHALGDAAAPHRRSAAQAGRLAPVLRRSPLILNRAIGELLYRHVG